MEPNNTNRDIRSKNFVLIPFCLICQAFQARGIVRYEFSATIKPIVEEFLKYNINIIQMPCPESHLGGYEKGLKRGPKGISEYDCPEFRSLCHRLASEVVEMIKAILSNGYEIVAILGIEYSPSCAVKYQYTRNMGTIRRSGIFIETLQNLLKKNNVEIPFIGVNRRGITKSLEEVQNLLREKSELKLI